MAFATNNKEGEEAMVIKKTSSRRQLPRIDELVKLIVTVNGPHQVRIQLYSLPLTSLHQLYKLATDLRFIWDCLSLGQGHISNF